MENRYFERKQIDEDIKTRRKQFKRVNGFCEMVFYMLYSMRNAMLNNII